MYKSQSAENSKDLITELRDLRKEIKEARARDDNDAVEELQDRQSKLEDRLQEMQNGWDRSSAPTVSAEDISEVISMWTGIPLTQLATEESERLLHMEEELSQHIIGQEEAIQTISKAVRRARAGLKNPRRPVGSFMFLGPTGVGKTELTKALARLLFGSEESLIQIDMSEFMERHTISRLVGAPPGYVGYEEAGQLTEAIRRKPYSIVVFDEVEKAHPEALQLLLQIMEEGHLTDAKGHKVDFRNAIIIMTSNIGADLIKRQSAMGFSLEVDQALEEQSSYQEMRKKLMDALKRTFRPEFINRLDSIVVFRALNQEDIRKIVNLELQKVADRLSDYELTLTITEAALDYLANEGFDPEMGARPVRRVIEQMVEEPLADALLAKTFKAGDHILIDLEESLDADGDKVGKIVLKAEKPETEEEKPPALIGA
jgi:ATP-dependent Clp protease ATP-binding subunit ClpC